MQSLTDQNQSTSAPRSARKRFTPQQRQQFVRRYLDSGLTQEQFVTREGISISALGKWLVEHRARGGKGRVRFQEVPLPAFKPTWAVEISTPQNWTVRLAQVPAPTALQQLLAALPC